MSFLEAAGVSAVLGVGATGILDLWGFYQAKAFRVRGMDYGLLGRWLAHLLKGRVRHEAISEASPFRYERVLGWMAHYAIGVAFAGALLAICGRRWVDGPTLGPAMALGLVTVAFPFLVLQPAMGAGFAASRTPDPNAARLRSLGSHAVFGLGLFTAAKVLALLRG